ncbi:DUF5666 domain-containing protein [Paraherbaspirillum soli]|uniref:DUF5666 domain-containing protein n=1 Tax=Paraherbaspirillum soli TaxID=631222 RepID=A0ABW0ME51_9BURK
MNLKQMLRALSILLLIGLLNACGGGGGSGTSGGGAKSTGVVTGIGSVFVNGVEFDSASAKVSIDDDQNRSESDIKVGMVVSVTGSVNDDHVTGTAQSIEFDGELVGPVAAAPVISAGGGSFTVMGQTVIVDSMTLFDNATGLADITAGVVVEVSGLRDASGQIHATRIEVNHPAATGFQVKGTISNLTTTTFMIGTLTVNFANATQINFPDAGLSNGLFVKVKSSAAPVNNVLIASSVKVRPASIEVQERDHEELEGFVAGLSGSSFTVNGQAVLVNAQTVFENGTMATLANNVRVEIEGSIASGVLVATKVEFRLAADVRIEAQVTQIDLAGGTITVFGNPGIVVKVPANTTQLRDEDDNPVRAFNLKNVAVGDRVAIVGIKGSANTVTATRLERTKASLQVVLRGPLDSAVSPTLVILGVHINTGAATVFTGSDEASLTQAAFFGLASAGTTVKASGTFDGMAIAATAASLGGD